MPKFVELHQINGLNSVELDSKVLKFGERRQLANICQHVVAQVQYLQIWEVLQAVDRL
jgi:hypothetical protein